MHLDHRAIEHVERIEDGHRRMRICGGVDHNPIGFQARLMDQVDQLTFVVGLGENDLHIKFLRHIAAHGLNIGQRIGTINLRLALPQQVQVRPVQNVDRLAHDIPRLCRLIGGHGLAAQG